MKILENQYIMYKESKFLLGHNQIVYQNKKTLSMQLRFLLVELLSLAL